MKRFISKFFLLFIAFTLTLSACQKAEKSCTDLQIEASNASAEFNEDTNNTAKCEAYMVALEAYIAKGCPDSGGFVAALDALPCRY